MSDIEASLGIPTSVLAIIALVMIVGVVTMILINRITYAQRREKLTKLLSEKSLRKKDIADAGILIKKRNVRKTSNRMELRTLDFLNPVSINRDLRRAGLPQMWFMVYVFSAVLSFIVGRFFINAPHPTFTPTLQIFSIFPAIFFLVRSSFIGMFAESRRLKSVTQLIQFIESAQRAVSVGTATEEAVAEAIRESSEPIKSSLMPISELLDLGYDFIEAITMASDQVNLPEFDIFVAALSAQSTTGGSIGDVMKEVADIARSRLDLQKKVSTMTAEGRFNAFLLGALPLGLMTYLRYGQPEYFSGIWGPPGEPSTLGFAIFFLTIIGAVLGSFVAVRISNIKV